jgi:hypothetical protein
MAEESGNNPNPQPKAESQLLWMAVFGMGSLLMLALAALGMAFFLSRTPQPQAASPASPQVVNNNYIGSQAAEGGAQVPATPGPSLRPDKPGAANRVNGSVPGPAGELPGNYVPVEPSRGRRDDAPMPLRVNSPPYYATVSFPANVRFRIRVLPSGPGKLSGAVPFRVRAWQPGADGRVAGVEASVPNQEDAENFSYLPEVAYKASNANGQLMSVEIRNPRKSSVVNDLRAPKGFQFFVAEITVKNLSNAPLKLDGDMFEIQDSDHVPYLPNPELLGANFPSAPLASSSQADFMAAFLVPADTNLSALVAREPGDGLISSPLNPQ